MLIELISGSIHYLLMGLSHEFWTPIKYVPLNPNPNSKPNPNPILTNTSMCVVITLS